MLTTFSIFWILNIFYQAISTFFVYWIHLCEPSYPALIREWIWLLFLFIVLILWYKKFSSYWKRWRKVWIAFIILIVVSVLFSILKDATLSNMFIWIKYGFRWTFILISASFFGYVISEKWQKSKLIQILPRALVWIVWVWFLWQWVKLLRPDFFYSLWYGGLDAYSQWTNPPIYYLTWYEWTLRRQWFFSWPNNYWYFLVAFLPFVWRFFMNKIKKEMVAPMRNLNFGCFGCAVSSKARIYSLTYHKQIIHNSRSNFRTTLTWTWKFWTGSSLWMKISSRKLLFTDNAWYRSGLISILGVFSFVLIVNPTCSIKTA